MIILILIYNYIFFRLYATFWLFSVNDLSAPISAYKREIEKCRKELGDVSEAVSLYILKKFVSFI